MAAATEACVSVALECADELDNIYRMHQDILLDKPLQEAVDKWVASHGGDLIKSACLEYPEEAGAIDLVQTPLQLGWKAGDPERILWVVPGDPSQEAKPVPIQEATAAEASKKPQVSAAAAADEVSKDPPAKKKQANAAEASKKPQASAAEAEVPKDSPAEASGNRAEAPETKKRQQAEKEDTPKKRAKAAAAKPTAKATPAPGTGAVPTGDDPIEYVQPNPKRAGTASGDRYALYMTARTVNEALALGAAPGDIPHDFKKGLLKRRLT